MSDVMNKLKQVNDPAVHNRRFINSIGKIISINEKANTCRVQYIDNDGYYKIIDNVFVKVLYPGIIGWFPKIDDMVELQINENFIIITGPYSYDYNNIQSKIKTTKDILHDNVEGTICGSIF